MLLRFQVIFSFQCTNCATPWMMNDAPAKGKYAHCPRCSYPNYIVGVAFPNNMNNDYFNIVPVPDNKDAAD